MSHPSAILLVRSMIGFVTTMACIPAVATESVPGQTTSVAGKQAMDEKHEQQAESPQRRLGTKTLGGRQFWGDRFHWQGWRIQQNVVTGHHRLVDEQDFRFASGAYVDCRSKLNDIQRTQRLKPMTGTVVVLIHGLGRSSKAFQSLSQKLKQSGLQVVPFDYPSTRIKVDKSAEFLESVLKSMPQVARVHFVVHSLGGLMIRRYAQKYGVDRMGRVVMLGVPNSGAKMADILRGNPLFKAVLGPAGQELISNAQGLAAQLSTPKFEFAVISGGRGNASGFNPLIPGDDDGTVSVKSTQLGGASDSAVVPRIHSFLMNDALVIEMTIEFLKTGRLGRDRPRQPIALPDLAEPDSP
jgi:pimeloyl-ACP methyl ester carboxylesterase